MTTDVDKNRELVSALVDGQLAGDAFEQAVRLASADADGQVAWQVYQCVGDVLRSDDLAHCSVSSDIFLSRMRERLSSEPPVVRPLPADMGPPMEDLLNAPAMAQKPVVPAAANASSFGWRAAAVCASLAAVAAVGWNVLQPGMAPAPQPLAQARVPVVADAQPVTASAVESVPVMIRDPRLDELLAAHKQFGGASALQMPAGFLRNATFEGPAR